jgi:hypothetical protein
MMFLIVIAAGWYVPLKVLAFLASQTFQRMTRETKFHIEQGRLLGSGEDQMSVKQLAFGRI